MIEPRTSPTSRTIWEVDTLPGRTDYENLAYLIKKYGCPVTKVSDGKDWIRVYFEIPITDEEAFLGEMEHDKIR